MSGIADQDASRAAPAGQADAFARAERHSRRVRLLKIALPAAALALAVVFFGATWLSMPGSVGFRLGSTAVEGGKLVMDNPELDGFTSANRPYSLNAARASQAIGNTNVIDLEQIVARLPLDDADWIDIEAVSGTFDRAANRLDITGAMQVTTEGGITARFRSASVDVGSGGLSTDEPVEIDLEGTRITADSMQVADEGEVMVFEQRVRMRIDGRQVQATRPGRGETQ